MEISLIDQIAGRDQNSPAAKKLDALKGRDW
jgi:hypothetical protein